MSGYKNTVIGEIPDDWEVRKIGDLFNVETGTTPSTKKRQYWKRGVINWLTPTDLSKLNGKIHVKESKRRITEKAMKDANLTLMPKGSIIVSTRAPVGYIAVLDEAATFNQGCKGLIPRNPNEINSDFYCYYLLSKKWMLENLSGGSTFKELSKRRLESFHVPDIPLQEQSAIAEILSSVDEGILSIGESLAKTARLKKGLMQKLLTEGFGHKEFKETKIGRVPKEWKVVNLGNILVECYRYPTYYNIEYVDKGVPEIRGELLSEDGQVEKDVTKFRFISKQTAKRFPKVRVEEGDIVLSVRGTMGKIGYISKDLEGAVITANLMRLSPDRKKIHPEYFMHYLLSGKFKHRLRALSTYTTIKTIQSPVLKSIRIALPPIPEQQEIAQILSIVNEKVDLDEKRKAKFERIKRGLMNDLLTGKRRVKVAM